MLHLLLGKAKTGKTTELLRRIGREGAHRPQILLVPEQYSHETERRLCREQGNRTAAFCEVLSFTRMANRVFAETGNLNRPVLDGGGRLLLMHEAVRGAAGTLSVYARPSAKPAFLENLLSTADELKTCCVPPEKLIEAGLELEGEEALRLHDLGMILSAYDALTAQRAEDPRDRLTRTAELLGECDYGRGWDFYLDSFTDFTPQQKLVLEVLCCRAHSVTLALTCDTLDPEGGLTREPSRRTALALLELAREAHIPADYQFLTGRKDGAPEQLAALEEGAFLRDPSPVRGGRDAVRIIRARNLYEEVEFAAGEILRLVREEGLRWREIVVAARTMEGYEDLIESVFRRYGIPVFLSRREDILQKPVLTLLTSALEIIGGGYEYEDIFRYLKTGLTGVPLEEVDRLENYALCWNLRGRQWTQEQDWPWHPEGYGQKWTEEHRAELKQLNLLRKKITAPLERLRSQGEGTGRELTEALCDFLEEIELPQRLTELSEELTGRGELQQAEEYRQLWDILVAAMEQCVALMGEEVLPLGEFAELFRLVLSQYDVSAIPVSLDRVAAGETRRFAHRETKVLFLLGVDDAHFPLVSESPGLLTDEDRALLRAEGWELAASADQRLDRETALACDALCVPSRRLYLSWPEQNGEECRPAALLERIAALLPEVQPEAPDPSLRCGAPLPALEAALREKNEPVLKLLREDPEWGERTARMEQAASLTRGSLSPTAVRALYGREIPLSASRMDTIRSCHFAYFMRYGIKAKPRREAGFDAPQVGTFVHYVLERVLREVNRLGGVKRLSKEEIAALVPPAVEQYIAEELGGLEQQTPRFRFLFRRLAASAGTIVENVTEELRTSEFQPIDFELGFGKHQSLPPVKLKSHGVTLSVTGFVDRVDGWRHNGKLYLRVVDYKTGQKKFSLTDVWHGLELQMLLYLFTLEQAGRDYFHEDVVATGVLYLPARTPILSGRREMSDKDRRKETDKLLCRSGMLLRDPEVLAAMEETSPGSAARFLPLKRKKDGELSGDSLATAEQWGKLRRHVKRMLEEIAGEIAEGNVKADPAWTAGRSYCDWCEFSGACHFEEGQGGDCSHYLYSVTPEEFWGEKENTER